MSNQNYSLEENLQGSLGWFWWIRSIFFSFMGLCGSERSPLWSVSGLPTPHPRGPHSKTCAQEGSQEYWNFPGSKPPGSQNSKSAKRQKERGQFYRKPHKILSKAGSPLVSRAVCFILARQVLSLLWLSHLGTHLCLFCSSLLICTKSLAPLESSLAPWLLLVSCYRMMSDGNNPLKIPAIEDNSWLSEH